MSFIDRLETVRAEMSMNKTKFADFIGINRSTLSSVINDGNKPSLDFFSSIGESCPNLNLHWLVTGVGNMWLDQQAELDTNKELIGLKKRLAAKEDLIETYKDNIRLLERQLEIYKSMDKMDEDKRSA